jgi:hypothetical protein
LWHFYFIYVRKGDIHVYGCQVFDMLTYNGQTKSRRAWAREMGISRQVLLYRLKAGWSVEAALTTPPLTRAETCLGRRHSEEARAKMATAKRGKPLSPEHRAAVSKGRKGILHTHETRAKISATRLRGVPRSEQTRAKISAALTGKVRSPEHSAAIGASLTGRKLSPEHRAAVSEGLRRLPDDIKHIVGEVARQTSIRLLLEEKSNDEL